MNYSTDPVQTQLASAGVARAAGAWPVCAALVAVSLLSACTSLLPSSKDEVVSDWNSYDDAVASLATIVPYQATRQDVHRQGLDPATNPAITVLHFADVLPKFTAAALVRKEDVDRGIRDCLQAGKQCSGYQVIVKKTQRRRTGDFWLDSLNFKRETVTQGWSVDALLVFVDDLLVYELVGGHPKIDEFELRRNPLGPLQGWGDRARP
jgi:hypothetical protein